MKKPLLLFALLLSISVAANAQFDVANLSVGLNGNYSMYKGDLDKSTPGAGLRIGYNFGEKTSAIVGFTYGLPIKESGTFEGDKYSSQINLSTVSVSAMYHLIGSTEDNFSFYVPVGGSYVMSTSKLAITGEPDFSEKASGFTINAGLGAQFKVGRPIVFVEGQFALPSGSSSSNTRTGTVGNDNPIPFHTLFNLGLKIPLGSE
jgi:hypothetical protein